MALPVEIEEFFRFISNFWMLLPLMIRQVFYLAFLVLVVVGFMKMIWGD